MTLGEKTAVVTGASRGLGRAVAARLANSGTNVIAVARDEAALEALARETGAVPAPGDVREEALAQRILTENKPDILVLNAGVTGQMKPIQEFGWDEFSATWQTDVKATLLWCQQAMRLPLNPGSHVVVVSSGAAMRGSILSGGYAGAKRMQWMMANYFREECKRAGLGLRFTTVLPNLTGDTDLSRPAADAYARRAGVTVDKFLENFGTRLTAEGFARHLAELMVSPAFTEAQTVRVTGDGVEPVEP